MQELLHWRRVSLESRSLGEIGPLELAAEIEDAIVQRAASYSQCIEAAQRRNEVDPRLTLLASLNPQVEAEKLAPETIIPSPSLIPARQRGVKRGDDLDQHGVSVPGLRAAPGGFLEVLSLVWAEWIAHASVSLSGALTTKLSHYLLRCLGQRAGMSPDV